MPHETRVLQPDPNFTKQDLIILARLRLSDDWNAVLKVLRLAELRLLDELYAASGDRVAQLAHVYQGFRYLLRTLENAPAEAEAIQDSEESLTDALEPPFVELAQREGVGTNPVALKASEDLFRDASYEGDPY